MGNANENKREVIAESIVDPQKFEGTTEQVAQGIIDKILWPAMRELSKKDQGEAVHFCHDLIASLTGCLVKVSGDKAKSLAALKEVQSGIGMLILHIEKLPNKPNVRAS